MRIVQTAQARVGRQEWSDWGERHGPKSREVTVERSGSCRDTITITLRDARVKESDKIRPGVIADFGYDGGVVGFEILQALKVVEQAGEMQFAIADH